MPTTVHCPHSKKESNSKGSKRWPHSKAAKDRIKQGLGNGYCLGKVEVNEALDMSGYHADTGTKSLMEGIQTRMECET